MFNGDHTIRAVDPELWEAIQAEHRRQHDHIELIASENYASNIEAFVAGKPQNVVKD